ncbi:MAG: hypothetical protein J0I42_15065 [Bosea sp.]|uniref:hypothetical protein n=1 Tax=Bosea sp. (in: a-proteobacteria) TaxID=1871050 RepID=UPI001AC05815|nr:hypothetical protein [Bosea sp. (in: a-proteobacteria)]MBN9453267.1 hypothetical protein [Bosea sp. (in: a-proteobacteria)]
MQYIEPVGAQGPANDFGRDYVDKNAGLGIAGSFLAADVPEHVQIEILNAIAGSGQTPAGANLKQLAYAIQKGMNYAAATGGANAWAITLSLAPLAYAAGLEVNVVVPGTNTSTSVTANINSLGVKPVKKRDGTDPAVGDIVGGSAYPTIYDGTNIRILTPLPSDIAALVGVNKSPFNVAQLSFTTRTALSGTGFVSFQSGSYTKKSATSDLVVRASTNLFSTATYAAAIMRLVFGATTLEAVAGNSNTTSNLPSPTTERKISGVAAGSVAWAISFGRNDANAWSSIVNPTTAGDGGNMPVSTATSLVIQEIEP